MSKTKNISLVLGLAGMIAITGERVAAAQDYTDEEIEDTTLMSRYGVALSIGGGVEDFTDSRMRSTTSVGGNWDLRLDLGSRMPVSIELGYLGSAADIDGQFSTNTGTLLGTTFEGAVKGNLPTGTAFVPFAFAGLGWRHYEVTSASFDRVNDGINDQDDLLEFPLGAGIAVKYQGLDADLRFTYRPVLDNDLVVDNANPLDPSYAEMHTWAVGARVGVDI